MSEEEAAKTAGTSLLIESIEPVETLSYAPPGTPPGLDPDDAQILGSPVFPRGDLHTILSTIFILMAMVALLGATVVEDIGAKIAAGVACLFFTIVGCTAAILRQLDRIGFGICWLSYERWLRRHK